MSETITEVNISIGSKVTFVDPKGQRHPALVTAVWGDTSVVARNARNARFFEESRTEYMGDDWLESANSAPYLVPSVNVVFIDGDESKTDPYGRQIARSTSVPHRSVQPAHGMYWE